MITLTERQKRIIHIIASSSGEVPITMKDIANTLSLSIRTIVREFKQIENWFLENDFSFTIKPGIGVMLNEDKNIKLYIIELLDINIDNSYSLLERKVLILTNLILLNSPIKSSYFIKSFNITETVFNSDFNELLSYLKNYNIEIIKKQGLGCYLVGEEQNLRNAYLNLIFEYYKDQDFIKILKTDILKENNFQNNVTNIILKLINKDTIIKIIEIVNKNIDYFNLFLSDESYMEFIFLIIISMKRIMQNEYIVYKNNSKYSIKNIEQFKFIETICLELQNNFKLDITFDEIIFISNHFKALKQIQNFNIIDNIRIIEIVTELIKLVENDLNVNLLEDSTFFNDLLNHLDTSIHRMKIGMKIRNPFFEDIKNEYSDVYNIVYNHMSCIKNKFNLDFIPDAEIAYITLHFIVAYERFLYKNIKINVILCCQTGIGTSKVLAEKILQKFQNINILNIIPTIKINDYLLKNNDVDLIISTANIETNLKFVKLNPIFDFESEKILKKFIFSISKEKLAYNNKLNNIDSKYYSEKDSEDIYSILDLSNDISYILKNFKFTKDISLKSFESLLNFVIQLYVDDILKQETLYNDFKNRLEVNFPYFNEINLLLLHCQSKSVLNIEIGIINLKNEVEHKNKKIKHILVIILPENSSSIKRELLSEISCNLINNKDFINTIKFADKYKTLNFFKNIMLNFLRNKLTF
ncbi:BglG family transcription antiterminator [[Clostridium] colinum]|uniref:BglG family transcription antiterminator n=1 Tax=[Clostridium] colinum TaxID=36835 RepID=UPI0020251AE0|nr:PRD domain-containing protein [[Clostridium] colinum]